MANRRLAGKTSCWLVGGLGCLGVAILGVVLAAVFLKPLAEKMGKIGEEAEKFQPVHTYFVSVTDAISSYRSEHNGEFPKQLADLAPKYLKPEELKPIEIEPGKPIKMVYVQPKPTDPDETVVIRSEPGMSLDINIGFGVEGFSQTHILIFKKDGRRYTRVVQDQPFEQSRGKVKGAVDVKP
ncbi:MAG: hypothetical protein HUU60_04055 [Armatimonadetes bacterium]|nr:hypothetical protein [Armatimonadota bacterium]